MNHLLLLGAGFSRNWGGWLASEVFEYLLGCSDLDPDTKRLLWSKKNAGGFEDALAELEKQSIDGKPHPRLIRFNSAIVGMFQEMDKAFREFKGFNFNQDRELSISNFLTRFDAIFSLNQDSLLERIHFPNASAGIRRWSGASLPGIIPQESDEIGSPALTKMCFPSSRKEDFQVSKASQPCFKLHGSFNWRDSQSSQLLIIGGEKSLAIRKSPMLDWYHQEFRSRLKQPRTRLLVIGYSFRDKHINDAITDAAKHLEVFIIDPLGLDIFERPPWALISGPTDIGKVLRDSIVGASRRSLREIFGSDPVEYGKLLRFLT